MVYKEGDFMFEKISDMPDGYAEIAGIEEYPGIHGRVLFYEVYGGTIVTAEIYGLPEQDKKARGGFFGFHIHEGSSCTGVPSDPLKNTGLHLNLTEENHPYHTGDLPPLLSAGGTAWMAVYTGRFLPGDVTGRTVVIHHDPDDFISQPAGMSGMKIACGVIRKWT